MKQRAILVAIFSLSIFVRSAQAADLKQLEVDLLEARYELTKSEENKIKLLRGLEGVLESSCKDPEGKGLSSRDFNNDELKEACKKWSEKAIDLDKNNQIAHCIRDGNKSKLCKGLYGGVDAEDLQPGTKGIIDRMERQDRERMKKPSYTQPRTKVASPEIIDSVTKLVRAKCPNPSERYTAPSKECKMYAAQLAQLQPTNQLAQCYLQGMSSRACHEVEEIDDTTEGDDNAEPESETEENDGFKGF